MEIEIEAVRDRGGKYSVEHRVGLCIRRFAHEGKSAQNTVMLCDRVDERAEYRVFIDDVDRTERHRLQCDAAFPLLAHLSEQRPGDRRLLRIAVDVGAQRAGAMRE